MTVTRYHEALQKIADKSKHPLPQLTTAEGKKVTVALRHGGNSDAFCALIRAQYGCRTCVSRSKFLGRLSILAKGRPIPLFMIHPKDLDSSYSGMAMANSELCMTPIVGISVLVGEFVGGFQEEEGEEPMTGRRFRHYHIRIPEDKRSEVDSREAALLEKAFHRYCPTLLPSLFETLLPRGGDDSCADKVAAIQTSLTIVKELLSQVRYGNRVAPSIDWLLRVVNYFKTEDKLPFQRSKPQMWIVSAQMLLWTTIHPDGLEGRDAVSPLIQQAHKFILPLLDKALNRSAMISMLETRLDPQNYQRPTAAPSDGQIYNAMNALGEFSNKILTHEEAALLPHAIVLKSLPAEAAASLSSSMDAFQAMLSSKPKPPSKNPAAFASRCATLETVKQLLAEVRAHPEKKLEVCPRGMHDIYVASTTLDPAKLCVPHLWAFLGSTDTHHAVGEWAEVVLVHPLFEYLTYKNVLFILKTDKTGRKSFGNCCFPEFLEVNLRRACRSALEEMNRRVALTVEPGTTAALGVGTSATNDAGLLTTPLRVRWDGREYSLTRL